MNLRNKVLCKPQRPETVKYETPYNLEEPCFGTPDDLDNIESTEAFKKENKT